MLEFILIFVAAGCAAGFMAGLLGIGGGFVIVPVLVWVLPLTGMPTSQVPHFAIGTSLLCICVTAIFSARAHHRRQAVDWPLFKLMVPALIVGSLSGSALAAVLSGKWLIAIFVMGALATAFYLLSGHQSKGQVDDVIFSSLCAPLGVKLAHKLPPRRLRQAFAAFMFFTSGHILYSQWLRN